MVLVWGYFYGILRANFPAAGAHFIFDCSLVGFYAGTARVLLSDKTLRLQPLRIWVALLITWPCLVCFFPFQPFIVSVVGLRGAIFFLPMLLVGALLADEDLRMVGIALACLNLAALTFAIAEYLLGVQSFYPRNPTTELIYNSNDVAGYKYLRIPATFVASHVFGGTMNSSLPIIIGLWVQRNIGARTRLLASLGLTAALVGVLLSTTRVNLIIAAVVALSMLFSPEIGRKGKSVLLLLLAGAVIFSAGNERTSRYKSLGDTSGVTDRIHGSVNDTFWEVIHDHPLGNGLGGGGTSMPYFLADLVREPVVVENEFGRLALELGIFGLLLWVCFIIYFITCSAFRARSAWRAGRISGWVYVSFVWSTSFIGLGTLTAIPQTALLLLVMGWVIARPLGALVAQTPGHVEDPAVSELHSYA